MWPLKTSTTICQPRPPHLNYFLFPPPPPSQINIRFEIQYGNNDLQSFQSKAEKFAAQDGMNSNVSDI